jgi:hypothetical protein
MEERVGHRPPIALLMRSLFVASAHTLLGMRCAHPDARAFSPSRTHAIVAVWETPTG